MIEVLHKKDIPSQLWFKYQASATSSYSDVVWCVMMDGEIYSAHYTKGTADEIASDLRRYFS